ncbi:hypothetical protein BCR34DRAFT_611716 [Clohesyomyces aquaticus]|uniref:BTB domain-containing protein n=1 Tax=Clohesyomyces aquaticus TaxID=1231657 RepID=A0A1Y2A0R9_9PLEO|nr:hypothetical protein BCR34DRAFT_611716 [Clohesyomyces aquaticus]
MMVEEKPAIFPTMSLQSAQVVVGDNKVVFSVPQDLLCSHSSYFQKALGPRFLEGQAGRIELPEVSEATFKIFLQWLYGQMVRSATSMEWPVEKQIDPYSESICERHHDQKMKGEESENEPDEEESSCSTMEDFHERSPQQQELEANETKAIRKAYNLLVDSLLDLYIFADRYETRHLRNDIMTTLGDYDDKLQQYPGLEPVAKAFDNLPASSTFCQYLVMQNALCWDPDRDSEEFEGKLYKSLPPEFLFQVMIINTRRANSENCPETPFFDELNDRCTFHEHWDEGQKRRCRDRRKADEVFFRNILVACAATVG